ncbi:hypothetical protein JQ557_33750 [Bradyrhizobium sp. U87765 SZCCT0131]|uniref:hypothetical protein n=1 Tax=unclassified Bradyrhizobium TaxID=2631580 RepID=UPI001BA743A3|nr:MULTISPECIES: hypothetical protein [unclassified Bradyrhizobium]MBR1223005.1 hypothetical protein [Bradyrhizobium sp. U87765 SZCCT0131]MBR1262741.1 hypothetical protein [Bradyrhizobium sp. U87765 SZCCT0134]MBR1308787.1 hypothetical protein [Bradyrhizobium sp. U87765 SZCCT0110]MBR1318523.1 hypothetical protein [Bradyrhizobium sp. U87765 SZCCT0109]MBR1352227.1 hypothetical protein [Bradyrhizobium sp. U87765 SZCCT0048]
MNDDASSSYGNYIIETSCGAAGIVIKGRRGFRFFSATQDFSCLDGMIFASPADAAAAARRQASKLTRRFA